MNSELPERLSLINEARGTRGGGGWRLGLGRAAGRTCGDAEVGQRAQELLCTRARLGECSRAGGSEALQGVGAAVACSTCTGRHTHRTSSDTELRQRAADLSIATSRRFGGRITRRLGGRQALFGVWAAVLGRLAHLGRVLAWHFEHVRLACLPGVEHDLEI
jgi:hypothetical protein